MTEAKAGPFRIERGQPFPTYSPDTLRAGLVNTDPARRVDIVLMNEDTFYARTDSQGETVFVEAARLSLRPDKALDMARLIVKCLDLLLVERPEQAISFGVTREKLREIGSQRFDALK
jgi:hypothetical protein